LPNDEYGWGTVALAYQEQSKEEILRNPTDMKKHWIKVLCNGMKKPTCRTREASNRIQQAMAIEKKILKKNHSGMMGFLLSEDEATLEGGEMVEENALQASLFGGVSASVGGEENTVNDSMELMEFSDQDDVNIPVPDIPPPCQRLSIQSQDDTGNKGVEEVMPHIRAGLRRAEDFMKTQKTKNLLNKNKERTSFARAIVKLVERQDLGGMAASMLMMLMRQLKAMNSSLDRQEQRERKQERRERKKRKLCKKCRAMKKAKKKSKKDTLAGLNDHGGKARQDSSSSSSSDSDSSNSDNDSSSDSTQSSNYDCGSWRCGGDIAVVDK
jgi:hypothetical protein